MITKIEVDEMIRLYVDEGLSTTEVAKKVGVSQPTVSIRLREAGVTMRPAGGRRTSAHVVDEMVRLYVDEGLSIAEVATQVGVSESAVSKHLRGAGVTIRSLIDQVAPQPVVDEMVRLYVDEGLSTTEISKRVGVSQATVSIRLRKAGVTMRPFGRAGAPQPVIDETVLLYVDEGLSTAEVAKKVGVHKSTVSTWLRKAEVTMRPFGQEGLPQPVIDEMIRLYVDEGLPATEIAKRVGVSQPTVSRHLRKAEVTIRRSARQPTPQPVIDEMIRLHVDEGLPATEIAKQVGIHHSTVSRYFRKAAPTTT